MDLGEQISEFKNRLRTWIGGDFEDRIISGASNVPFWIPGGFRIGLWNLENTPFERFFKGRMVFGTSTTMPGGASTFFLAFVFDEEGITALKTRRDDIRRATGSRANNAAFYLYNGAVYLSEVTDLKELPQNPSIIGTPIPICGACFTDVLNEGTLGLVASDFVSKLGRLLSPVQFIRLGALGRPVGGPPINPTDVPIDEIVNRIEGYGLIYERSLVERFHCAMNSHPSKHFVLLTGISGTGKSQLAKAYAYAILGIPLLNRPSDDFEMIAVHPEWTEPAQLIGYYNALTQRYHIEPFLNAVLRANSQPHRPVFACLDEMNLAQPEFYFADVLSIMENPRDLRLHDADPEEAGVNQAVPWPSNLYVAGTVNVDETTRPFSHKVLDRANVINMSEVAISREFEHLRNLGLGDVLTNEVMGTLKRMLDILSPSELHFGYRTIEEICRYLQFARSHGLLGSTASAGSDGMEVLDIQIEQKILTKVRGGPEHAATLDKLEAELKRLPRSQATVQRMKRDLLNYSSFQYWT